MTYSDEQRYRAMRAMIMNAGKCPKLAAFTPSNQDPKTTEGFDAMFDELIDQFPDLVN